MRLTFTVPGLPKAQPRPRARAIVIGGRTTARVYDPGSARAWKQRIAATLAAYGAVRFVGPVEVEIRLYLPRPKKHFGRRGPRPGAPTWHGSRPDVDNLAKPILDAITARRWWKDDAQVARLVVLKMYTVFTDDGNYQCEPSITVSVGELTPMKNDNPFV